MHRLRMGFETGRVWALVGCALLVLGLGGCGEDEARPSGPVVTLTVTDGFGNEKVAEERYALSDHRTAARLLDEGGEDTEGPGVLTVNGVQPDAAPAEVPLSVNDVVQFDRGDRDPKLDIPATVGAFPRPFTGGFEGEPFPVTVRCWVGYHVPCDQIRALLRRLGVDPSGSKPKPSADAPIRRARIFVGPWYRVRTSKWARRIERSPLQSGVFTRVHDDTRSMELLDVDGRAVREDADGPGLVAALRPSDDELLWLVTGTDIWGVERAVQALKSRAILGASAVAATSSGVEKLPLPAR